MTSASDRPEGETEADPLAAAIGRQLSPVFAIERELKPGGQARVFVAMDVPLNRRVVIKVFGGDALASSAARRFHQEITLIAALQHPNIVPILTSGEIAGHPFYVMPYIAGESLRAHVRRVGPLPVREVVRILRDIARALVCAHAHGIVHRDIKPDNVLLADGAAVVADFGIARMAAADHTPEGESDGTLTATGEMVGTPAYMAPEQIAFDPAVDHRADIYAFGIVGYEMLSGGPLFGVRTPQSVVAAHLTESPAHIDTKRPGVPPALGRLLAACLEKNRDLRPASAAALLEALDDSMDSSDRFTVDADAPASHRSRGAKRILTGGAVGAAVIALVLWYVVRPAMRSGAAAEAPSVLVLPFDAVGGDSTAEFVAEGVSSELVATLTRIPSLRVVVRPPAPEVRRRYSSTPALATAMHATWLIEGSIQRSGARVRISARLVDATSGYARWAQTFDHRAGDVFGAQDEIVSAVGVALRANLTDRAAPEHFPAIARGTSSAEAYDAYTRARFFFGERGEEPLQRSIHLLDHAVALDPAFARAFALRAEAEAVLPIYTETGSDSILAAAIADASHAIALDSTLSDAWTARASLRNGAFEWDGAESDFRRALALAPSDPLVHEWFGEHLLVRGRVREAVSELTRAVDLDPLSPIARASLAVATSLAGERGTAIGIAKRAVALDSSLFATQLMLGSVLVFDGRVDSALVYLRSADRIAPDKPLILGMLGYAEARAGMTAGAREILERLRARSDRDGAFASAHVLIALGDTGSALAALERSVAQHSPQLTVESLYEPVFEPLRSSARYRAIAAQLRLER